MYLPFGARILTATVLTSVLMAALPAAAQSDDTAALQSEIEALKARLTALEAKLEETSAKQEQAAQSRWAGGLRWSDPQTGSAFRIGGRMHWDVGYVEDATDDPGLGLGATMRRGRITLSGEMKGGFSYDLNLDLDDDNIRTQVMQVGWSGGPWSITLGQQRVAEPMEEMTSSNYISFLERSAITDAFGFAPRVGIGVQYSGADWLASVGLLTGTIGDLADDENKPLELGGRLVYAPKFGTAQMHFGANSLYRWLDQGGNGRGTLRYRQRPHINTTDTRFVATPTMDADAEFGVGAEFAMQTGRFYAASELYRMRVVDARRSGSTAAQRDYDFWGGYVEAGLSLTGESRSYKGGTIGRTKVLDPFDKGGSGAWLAQLKLDYIDLNDADITGGKQTAYLGSLIWMPIDYVRFIAQYGLIDVSDLPGDVGFTANTLGGRAQIDF